MDEDAGRSRAAIGFAVKSGWAAVVLLSGSPSSPRVADSRRIDLSDPALPGSRQPYHAGFGTGRGSGPELRRLVGSVRRFGRRAVTALIRTYTSAGHQLTGAGVVVGSLIDPDRIANEHVRIHALEGQLFRGVVHEAVLDAPLACSIWRERDLYGQAAEAMGQSEQDLRADVTALGRAVAGAWRAEQKAATVAAWLMLAGRDRGSRPMRRADPAGTLQRKRRIGVDCTPTRRRG
jgi:hypothetical protein